MTQELRERVVAAITDKTGCWGACKGAGPASVCRCEVSADAAIAIIRGETLEEAAKVAEASPDSHWGPTIAAAIRALKEKSNG